MRLVSVGGEGDTACGAAGLQLGLPLLDESLNLVDPGCLELDDLDEPCHVCLLCVGKAHAGSARRGRQGKTFTSASPDCTSSVGRRRARLRL